MLEPLCRTAWSVYIIRCADRTLYTGVSPDVEARVKAHNAGRGAKYTRGRGPVKLVWSKEYASQSEALQVEYRIKKLSRIRKLFIIWGDEKPPEPRV